MKFIFGGENDCPRGVNGVRAIEVNVVRRDAEVAAIRRTLARYRDRLVSPLKHMTTTLMPRIPSLAESAHQIAHPIDEIRLGSFQEQMKVIRYQDIRMNFPPAALTNFRKSEEKAVGIFVIEKDPLATIATSHHMILSTSIFKA